MGMKETLMEQFKRLLDLYSSEEEMAKFNRRGQDLIGMCLMSRYHDLSCLGQRELAWNMMYAKGLHPGESLA